MECSGVCKCGEIEIEVLTQEDSLNIRPRVCDCDYCKKNPSQLVSHPDMKIHVQHPLQKLNVEKNGDGLASFFRCSKCHELIFVGCVLNGALRGAVNASILDCDGGFGDILHISPKSLGPDEKMERWDKLWGTVHESVA